MPKRERKAAVDLDEDIKVGEGTKQSATGTMGLMSSMKINTRLWDAPELEWEKIESALTAYPEFAGRLEGLEGKQDLLKLFEKFPGASLSNSFYDHGSPGCSGFYLEASVTRKHLEYVQNAFSALLMAIDTQLGKLKNLPKNQ